MQTTKEPEGQDRSFKKRDESIEVEGGSCNGAKARETKERLFIVKQAREMEGLSRGKIRQSLRSPGSASAPCQLKLQK